MTRLLRFFIKNGLFGDVLTVVIIALGVYSLFSIRREVFPNVNFDVITVTTLFRGATPEEVEKFVTNPLEQELKEIDGIKRLQSYSVDGRSLLIIQLDPDQTTSSKAKPDIQNIVERWVLPDGVEKPIVIAAESKQSPIIEVSLSGEIPEMELRSTAKRLEKELEKLPGVAQVVPHGLQDLEISVSADAKLLRKSFVTLDDIIRSLHRENQSIPGGTIEGNPERFIRTIGSFEGPGDIENSVVRANELANPIRVKDIATVTLGLEKKTRLYLTNGAPAINLTVLKKEHADAIDLVDTVKTKMKELQSTLNPAIKVAYLRDMSYFIKRRLNILTSNLLLGLGLVLILLPLMMPFKFSMIIALGEPFAFLGTLLVLQLTGNTINLISMIGLIIVSGILVDDSIVVTENTARLISDGIPPKKAAFRGVREILGPVTASVLTTSMAFLPMAFMSGIFGKFIRQIPIAVITALLVSLFETLFILPAHAAHWIRSGDAEVKPKGFFGFWFRTVQRSQRVWDTKVVPLYERWLRVSLKNRYWVAAGFIVLFLGSVLFGFKVMRFVLFPTEGIEVFFIRIEAPVGINLQAHRELLKPLEATIKKLPSKELDSFVTEVGIHQQDPNDPLTRRGGHLSQIMVNLTPEPDRDRMAFEIIDAVKKEIGQPPGFTHLSFARMNPGPPVGKPVSIGVQAEEYADILPVVAFLKEELSKIPGITDLSDTYTLGKKEVTLQVNRAEASASGIAVDSIGNTVRSAFDGIVATQIRKLDEEIAVRVLLKETDRSKVETLKDLYVPNLQGALIPVSRVTTQGETQGLALYQHEDRRREIKVLADINTEITTASRVNDTLKNRKGEFEKKFPKVVLNLGGEAKDTDESMASLYKAFVIAVCGIFLVLLLTFRRLLQPLLVLLTIPMGLIAVIWAFSLHGMPLSFLGMLGVIALSGIIVNNAIVFMDFVNQRRTEGQSKEASIMEAAKIRLRPIFLTTITTVIGVLPTAYGIGGLDKFVVPIAMALGWGLMFGSLLTAFIFPAALAILDDFSEFLERLYPRLVHLYD